NTTWKSNEYWIYDDFIVFDYMMICGTLLTCIITLIFYFLPEYLFKPKEDPWEAEYVEIPVDESLPVTSSRRRKLFFMGLRLAACIFAMITSWLYFSYDPDIPQPSLDFKYVTIIEEKNAFQILDKVNPDFDYADRDSFYKIAPSDPWIDDFDQLLDRNVEVMQSLNKALLMKQCQVPRVLTGDQRLPYLIKFRTLAYLQEILAEKLAREGKSKHAFHEAIKIFDLANMVENSQGILIHWLVGMSIRKIGLECMSRLARRCKENQDFYNKLINELQTRQPSLTAEIEAYQGEYFMICNDIDNLQSQEIKDLPVVYFKPNQLKSYYAEEFMRHYSYIPFTDIPERVESTDTLLVFALTSNAYGKNTYWQSSNSGLSIWHLKKKWASSRRLQELTMCMLGIMGYYHENGELPDDLEKISMGFYVYDPKNDFIATSYNREKIGLLKKIEKEKK
ncbi:MAG: hypothetical protein HRT89_20240, partial [Lentisphaeria bacterium]|nr:hypothetical protein [Lentisphaeria bacterium]